MTFDEIKAQFPEHCTHFYGGLTQEQAFSLPCESWATQSAGLWYAAAAQEVPELAAYEVTA